MKKGNMIKSILVQIGWADAQYVSGSEKTGGVEVYTFTAKDEGKDIGIRVDVLGDFALIFIKSHLLSEWEYQGYEKIQCYHNSGNTESIPVANGTESITICQDCLSEV